MTSTRSKTQRPYSSRMEESPLAQKNWGGLEEEEEEVSGGESTEGRQTKTTITRSRLCNLFQQWVLNAECVKKSKKKKE